jgi:hypothetical protein
LGRFSKIKFRFIQLITSSIGYFFVFCGINFGHLATQRPPPPPPPTARPVVSVRRTAAAFFWALDYLHSSVAFGSIVILLLGSGISFFISY